MNKTNAVNSAPAYKQSDRVDITPLYEIMNSIYETTRCLAREDLPTIQEISTTTYDGTKLCAKITVNGIAIVLDLHRDES